MAKCRGPVLDNLVTTLQPLTQWRRSSLNIELPAHDLTLPEARSKTSSTCKGPLPLAFLTCASLGFPAPFLKYFGILYLIFQAHMSSPQKRPHVFSIKMNTTLLCVCLTLCAIPVSALNMSCYGCAFMEYIHILNQISSYLETGPSHFSQDTPLAQRTLSGLWLGFP